MAAMTPEQITTFRAAFPAFADANLFPDAMLQVQWTIGACYISDRGCNCASADGTDCRETMQYLMLAHLLQLGQIISAGGTNSGAAGIVSMAKVDKVSVSLVPPPVTDAWDWWLNGTPYGAQLLALLSVCGMGGFYAGGLPEPTAFRKWGGIF